MNRRLPVILIGGFSGAGKTSLLHHFISEHTGGNLAILVENPGTPNLDAKAIRGLCGAMRRFSDTVVEIPAREETEQVGWLANQFRELAANGRFERVLIEVGGMANPARLARSFGPPGSASGPFAAWAQLDEIICVVDALDFYRGTVAPSPSGAAPPFADFQRAQIEDASLIVLNKCDLVQDAERDACVRLLSRMHPETPWVEVAYGELPAEVWSRPGRREGLERALERRERMERENPAAPETADPDLSSMLYRAYRPFHPGRFWDWFNAENPGLLRVKGLIWLATRNLVVGGISRTRWQNSCGGAGIWWAALPREEWPQDPEALARMQETWREPYGDRRQELVLLGEPAALQSMRGQLDACLLSAEEYARPVQQWTTFPDPFPTWDMSPPDA